MENLFLDWPREVHIQCSTIFDSPNLGIVILNDIVHGDVQDFVTFSVWVIKIITLWHSYQW